MLGYGGRHRDAEALFWRALEGCEAALGAAHPDTLASVSFVAAAMSKGRHLGVAEELGELGLKTLEPALGANYVGALQADRNLIEVRF